MIKTVVYLDMDGPLAHFRAGVGPHYTLGSDPPEMFQKGFFRDLPVTPGAKEAVAVLLRNPHLDLYIASKPTTKNLYSTIEKYQWVEEHFPELFKKIFLTCDKGHLNGDFLVDDDHKAWADKFKGIFLKFHEDEPLRSWEHIVKFLDICGEEH
jgi:5'(3')-deoxyribonucleotidase